MALPVGRVGTVGGSRPILVQPPPSCCRSACCCGSALLSRKRPPVAEAPRWLRGQLRLSAQRKRDNEALFSEQAVRQPLNLRLKTGSVPGQTHDDTIDEICKRLGFGTRARGRAVEHDDI